MNRLMLTLTLTLLLALSYLGYAQGDEVKSGDKDKTTATAAAPAKATVTEWAVKDKDTVRTDDGRDLTGSIKIDGDIVTTSYEAKVVGCVNGCKSDTHTEIDSLSQLLAKNGNNNIRDIDDAKTFLTKLYKNHASLMTGDGKLKGGIGKDKKPLTEKEQAKLDAKIKDCELDDDGKAFKLKEERNDCLLTKGNELFKSEDPKEHRMGLGMINLLQNRCSGADLQFCNDLDYTSLEPSIAAIFNPEYLDFQETNREIALKLQKINELRLTARTPQDFQTINDMIADVQAMRPTYLEQVSATLDAEKNYVQDVGGELNPADQARLGQVVNSRLRSLNTASHNLDSAISSLTTSVVSKQNELMKKNLFPANSLNGAVTASNSSIDNGDFAAAIKNDPSIVNTSTNGGNGSSSGSSVFDFNRVGDYRGDNTTGFNNSLSRFGSNFGNKPSTDVGNTNSNMFKGFSGTGTTGQVAAASGARQFNTTLLGAQGNSYNPSHPTFVFN